MDAVTFALLKKKLETKASLVDGKVPAEELPSYVDDVVEYEDLAHFPEEGERSKIYVALDTGCTYRWSGSEYIQIGGQDLSDYYTKQEIQTELNSKQDTIEDLSSIRSGASAGATAIQQNDLEAYHDSSKQDALTTSSVTSGTLDEVIGFDANGDLVRGTIESGLSETKIVDAYSSSSTYNIGALVSHEGSFYICKTAIIVAEAWTSAH